MNAKDRIAAIRQLLDELEGDLVKSDSSPDANLSDRATEGGDVLARSPAADAVSAMFDLTAAIDDNDLTISDLTEMCKLAIESGHAKIQIALKMMSWAVGKAEKAKASKVSEP